MAVSVEQTLCWLTWLFGVLYSLYEFCQVVDGKSTILDPLDFEDGWAFLQRKKDVSDVEWVVLTSAFKKYWMLLFFHVVFTQIILSKNRKVLLAFHSVYSVVCLVFIVGPYISIAYISYVLLMWATHITQKKIICYAVTFTSLCVVQQECVVKMREACVPEKVEGFLVDVGFVWLVARCLSFSIDRIDAKLCFETKLKDFAMIISYCFYLPAVFTGPLLTYESFTEQISHCERKRTSSFTLVLHFIHPVCGYFILEFLLHYVYSSSVQFYPVIVARFDSWSLCGLGYALPTLFYLKYFVIYSLSGSLAKLEHIDLPPPPKCISRINVPSLLWRTFDRGLYLWLLKYLYFPVVGGKWSCHRKICALALSFSFVCIWHGMDKAICAWTVLNFLNVVLEMATSFITSTGVCKRYEMVLSNSTKKRLDAFVSTPHFMLMCISSCFFLSNWDIGYMVLQRILFGGLIPFLPTAIIMFCGCRVASDVKEWETNRSK